MAIFSYILSGLTSYAALTLSLFGLSVKVPRAGFFARCLAAYASLLFCAAYGVLASICLRIAGRGQIAQWTVARAFKWSMWLTTGVHFDIIQGQKYLSTRPAVFLVNHQTELDVLLLGAVLPQYSAVTAKRSLSRVPLLGWFMSLSGTVFIDRANRETAFKAFDNAASLMKSKGQSVIIFPEGTRSYAREPTMLPFKKGAFHLAVKAEADIVPIVAENYSHVLDVKKMKFTSGTINVKVLPPVSTKGLTTADVDSLVQNTRQSMLDAMVEMDKMRKIKDIADSQVVVEDTPRATRSTAVEI
ncbi:1-acyl-sn-glycerol-3-phosphate acyltransferase beta [Nannizzia gypsea CBS 118893]|uniref:1-acyl-sn-glycerol-3-phosphate acyltransferase n=1 Tax=Arthroderma gypseum (strain ATCC MYA-4604 / CBS 118893) TaxID=535722 RepID=E4UQ16_ARTGP|nr:1-acyl-sn-glycerol-3-phosphate acyltransferase beta [Nannizzia gypsea CBS 118893]EFQ99150.1 1-acyl-sn-glycerol-3-phosphate acyltransferase beta [Nannizzia gypsea CBS 118893]